MTPSFYNRESLLKYNITEANWGFPYRTGIWLRMKCWLSKLEGWDFIPMTEKIWGQEGRRIFLIKSISWGQKHFSSHPIFTAARTIENMKQKRRKGRKKKNFKNWKLWSTCMDKKWMLLIPNRCSQNCSTDQEHVKSSSTVLSLPTS